MKELGMMRTIVALSIVTLLGLLPGTPVVKESLAYSTFVDDVNGFCPSQPLDPDTSCDSCHGDGAARAAILAQNYCYFCPADPPCEGGGGGGACAASAEASVTGPPREKGPSRLLADLAWILLPLGAVIGLSIRRRKK